MSGIKGKSGVYKHKKHSKETKDKIRKNNARYWLGKKMSDEHKRKIGRAGELSPSWKGDKVSYYAIHIWVVKEKGSPDYCIKCNKKGEKTGRRWNMEWANIDHKYRRDLNDYIGLCSKCHKKYDLKKGLIKLNKRNSKGQFIKFK